MAYNKLQVSRYNALGGMNNKVSTYLNGPLEFLNIKNFDFQVPGALTKRWGSTQYFGASLSGKVQGIYEYTRLSGESYLVVASGGTLGFAFQDGFSSQFSGISLYSNYRGFTFFFNGIVGYTTNFSMGSSLSTDFVTNQNQMFFCNQKGFFKHYPETIVATDEPYFFFGLPRMKFAGFSFSIVGTTAGGVGITGIYYFKFAYRNSYNLCGSPSLFNASNTADISAPAAIGMSGTGLLTLRITPTIGQTSGLIPPGIDAFNEAGRLDGHAICSFYAGPFGTSLALNEIDNQEFNYIGPMAEALNGAWTQSVLTANMSGLTLMNSNIIPWDWWTYTAYSPGQTNLQFKLNADVGNGVTLIPSMLEIQGNRLWAAGMSYALSSVFFSEQLSPEWWEPDYNFEVRTDDGEPVTAIKAYNGNLVVFKTSTFHVLSNAFEEDQNNFILTEISSEYGCLSNRAVAEYQNQLVFLDRKGVIQFNGTNIKLLSSRLDPLFQRMNVDAAKQNSSIVYDKDRDQLLIDIPVDGSTQANLTVVYDIENDCWSTYEGYRPAYTAIAQGQLSNQKTFIGGYSGLVSWFGPSFTTDNGVGFTTLAKSGFVIPINESTTKQFRRVFMDNTPQGSSSAVGINIYQDYGSSIITSGTLYQGPFQSRLDFGVQAKSMAAEFVMGSTFYQQLHGFTIEYRFQRKT